MQKKEITSNYKSLNFKLKRILLNDDAIVYNKFTNWVNGEFDLYLKNESENLKVYFPNGWFRISCLNCRDEYVSIEVVVKAKSKVACQQVMNKLELIYDKVLFFNELKFKSSNGDLIN